MCVLLGGGKTCPKARQEIGVRLLQGDDELCQGQVPILRDQPMDGIRGGAPVIFRPVECRAVGLVSMLAAKAAGLPHRAPDAMGPRSTVSLPAFTGTFDKHLVLYIYTDSSNRARARADHVTYSPSLAKLLGSATPVYFVVNGGHARGPIFTNRPDEAGYTPLGQVVEVHWKSPATAAVLESDEQIRQLAGKGVLALTKTATVINAPIVKVASGETGPESGGE
jgi:hypothetical protein